MISCGKLIIKNDLWIYNEKINQTTEFMKSLLYRYKHWDVILLFAICVCVFSYLIIYVNTDIQAHVRFIKQINDGSVAYPPNLGFYFIVNLLSGFSSNNTIMLVMTGVLLSSASVAKYVVSKKVILSLNRNVSAQHQYLKVTAIALGLFFCFAIPDPVSLIFLKKMYLGKIVPLVWHNSTTILLFPFALLLFWKQLESFETERNLSFKKAALIHLLVVINIIIKPSFLFCYLPATFLFLMTYVRKRNMRWLLVNLSPLFLGGVLILLQYYLIYTLNIGSFKKAQSGVMLTWPFHVYTFWIPGWLIPLSFLLSYALPIGAVILYREILKYKPFFYALLLSAVGLGISAVLLESGPRMEHGNFTWQNVVCSFILFLAVVSFLVQKFLKEPVLNRKNKILVLLFALHVVSGFLYLFKILITNSYT